MLPKVLFGLLLSLLTLFIGSANATLMPTLTAEKEALQLTRVAIEVKIHGFLAETRMTMTFGNHHHRPLAGDLYFPLPEGATVSGYALDVNGVMVDGVVVEREKARQVFESEVRKGVDPGLVEAVAGNNFKTRVFPIPANGSRTIMVRYVSRLGVDNGQPVYELPLHFSKPVKQLSVRVEVLKPTAAPQVRHGSLSNFSFNRWQDSYVAESRLTDIAIDDSLIIALPATGHATAIAEYGRDGGARIALQDNAPPQPSTNQATLPRQVTILWDASGSRGQVGHATEKELLRRYFAKFDRNVAVTFIPFSNRAHNHQSVIITNGDATPLLQLIEDVTYDGGTSLAELRSLLETSRTDLFLLFSDGLANLGGQTLPTPQRPLYAVSDDPRANHRLLRQLSGKGGGTYLNLATINLAQAVATIDAPPVILNKVLIESGRLSEIYPGEGAILTGGPVMLTARLESPGATVTLIYTAGDREVGRRTFAISQPHTAGNLVELFWAQQKLEELLTFPDQNRKQIQETGVRYGLVTPQTSLLVLETVEQYITHRIAPPVTLPDMLQRYQAAIDRQKVAQHAAADTKRKNLLSLWQKRLSDLNQHYNYEPGFKYKDVTSRKMAEGAPPRPAPLARPSMPAAAAQPSPEREEFARRDEAMMPRSESSRNGASKKALISGSAATGAQIVIPAWDPATPWLLELKKTAKGQQYKRYLELRQKHGQTPGFYLDCADFFIAQGDQATGIRILTNLAELELENPALLRVMGYRLAELKSYDLAVDVFEQLLRIRSEEAVSWRDLALVLSERAEQNEQKKNSSKAQIAADYSRSIELYNHLIVTPWARDNRTELVALAEVNRLIPKARSVGVTDISLDPAFIKALELDLRIVIAWDRDMTDLDLHVIEPSGEEAYYSHNHTTIGGLVSFDVTGGYGPEEYLLRKGMDGLYQIAVKYFGANNPSMSNTAVLRVDIFTNYGRPDEKHQTILRRLEGRGEMLQVGRITLGE